MTTRPELKVGRHLLTGLVAVALFAVMATVFLGTPFGAVGADPGFSETTVVANESVAQAGTDVQVNVTAAGVVANVGGETQTIAPYTDVTARTVTAGGQVYVVVEKQTSVTESLGYAMFNLNNNDADGPAGTDGHSRAGIESEGFLLAFEIIDVVLVAALIAAVMLARREGGGAVKTALAGEDEDDAAAATDGGRDPTGGER